MKIVIPYDPPNWNEYINLERGNKYVAGKLKREEKQLAAVYGRRKKYTGRYPVKLTVWAHFKTRRKDLDNTRIKGLLDGLVQAGVIQDDSLKYIQGLEIIPVFDGKQLTEFEFEELEHEESKTGCDGHPRDKSPGKRKRTKGNKRETDS